MAHHEPFKSLGPLAWEDVDSTSDDALPDLLSSTFTDAQILIDSLPIPSGTATAASVNTPTTGRARSKTESAAASHTVPLASPSGKHQTSDPATSAKIQKEWKECKVKPQDNPLGISVYKLSAKDGKGAWFARRSVHQGLSFDKWKMALEREFAETLARSDRQGSEPGTGNIRGIGAERRVERKVVEGKGAMEMFLVSARFPGPTTPRDFVTLLLMSPTSEDKEEDDTGEKRGKRQPRQFMLVSRPCAHPDCPPRTGFIRGQYESVEVIREIPIDKPLRRVRSSVDINRDALKKKDTDSVAKEAVIRSASKAQAANDDESSRSVSPPPRPASAADVAEVDSEVDAEETEMAIEWLMVTRSDPGGSVPRWMVEKGTPGGITNDAGKFVKWLSATKIVDVVASTKAVDAAINGEIKEESEGEGEGQRDGADRKRSRSAPESTEKGEQNVSQTVRFQTQTQPSHSASSSFSGPQGFYGMISGALGAATSVVASTVAAYVGSAAGTDSEHTDSASSVVSDDESDTSSEQGYVSAEDGETAPAVKAVAEAGDATSIRSSTSSQQNNTLSTTTTATTASTNPKTVAQHEKELRKLQRRRTKAQEKMVREQERLASKKQKDDKESEAQAAALVKLREKHEKEIAKQEEKYQRDLKKLEEKRRAEERKLEERKRKQAEREEKANVQMEMEKLRTERDVAIKEMEILRGQVGELQKQNTMLVARLGKLEASQNQKSESGGNEKEKLEKEKEEVDQLEN
ncbi:hypothetical protein B0H66DRAFT_566316 [Apodospora peruviana]|uniref:DUF3074 domain-containing protein n=1 Tax=Apodospora peruviana TaxID=516989 RepID=A0AAE0HV83_9PEZI|nr:hypothetical protein B0H66DRAFT_566316 [Apodospora peruviana]